MVHRLQSVLNAAARLTYHLRWSDHNHRRVKSPLAGRAGASSVQDCSAHVQKYCAVSWSFQSRLVADLVATPAGTICRTMWRLRWSPCLHSTSGSKLIFLLCGSCRIFWIHSMWWMVVFEPPCTLSGSFLVHWTAAICCWANARDEYHRSSVVLWWVVGSIAVWPAFLARTSFAVTSTSSWESILRFTGFGR